MITIAVVAGGAGRAYNCTSSVFSCRKLQSLVQMQDKAAATLLRLGSEGRLSYTLNHSPAPVSQSPR